MFFLVLLMQDAFHCTKKNDFTSSLAITPQNVYLDYAYAYVTATVEQVISFFKRITMPVIAQQT